MNKLAHLVEIKVQRRSWDEDRRRRLPVLHHRSPVVSTIAGTDMRTVTITIIADEVKTDTSSILSNSMGDASNMSPEQVIDMLAARRG